MGGTPEQQAAAAAYAQQQAKLAQLLKMKAEGKLTPQQEAALAQFQAQNAKMAPPAAAASPAASAAGISSSIRSYVFHPVNELTKVRALLLQLPLAAWWAQSLLVRPTVPSPVVSVRCALVAPPLSCTALMPSDPHFSLYLNISFHSVQTERKTEFWMDLMEQMEKAGGFKMDAAVQNDIIARTLSLQLVLDKVPIIPIFPYIYITTLLSHFLFIYQFSWTSLFMISLAYT